MKMEKACPMGLQGVMGPDTGGFSLPPSARCLAGTGLHRPKKTPRPAPGESPQSEAHVTLP